MHVRNIVCNWAHGTIPHLCNINGFAMHYYCGTAGDQLTFTEEEWTAQLEKAQVMEFDPHGRLVIPKAGIVALEMDI